MRLNFVAVALLALVAACAGPGASPPAATDALPASASAPLSVTLVDFKIQPSALTAATGTVVFAIDSNGPTPHNFTVRDAGGALVGGSQDLRAGENTSLTLDLAAGGYTYFCALAGHESLGMHGTLTITAR